MLKTAPECWAQRLQDFHRQAERHPRGPFRQLDPDLHHGSLPIVGRALSTACSSWEALTVTAPASLALTVTTASPVSPYSTVSAAKAPKGTAVNSSVRDSKNANPLLHIIPYLLFHTGSAGGTSAGRFHGRSSHLSPPLYELFPASSRKSLSPRQISFMKARPFNGACCIFQECLLPPPFFQASDCSPKEGCQAADFSPERPYTGRSGLVGAYHAGSPLLGQSQAPAIGRGLAVPVSQGAVGDADLLRAHVEDRAGRRGRLRGRLPCRASAAAAPPAQRTDS